MTSGDSGEHLAVSPRSSSGVSPLAQSGASPPSSYGEVKGCFIIEYATFSAPRVAQAIHWCSSVTEEMKHWLYDFLTKELLHVAESKTDYFAVRLLSLKEVAISAVVATFTYADVGCFTVCINFEWGKKLQLHAAFLAIRDYLERIYHRILEAEEEVVVVKEWTRRLSDFLPLIHRWVTCSIARKSLSISSTFLGERKEQIALAAVVGCCAAHHRCIVRGDNEEDVKKWIHTAAYFLLDDRLAFASDAVAKDVDDIVPDLHLQGTTAVLNEELLQKLYHFRYPCCVIDISKRADMAAHHIPSQHLNKFREERWRHLVHDAPIKDNQVLTSIRVKPQIIRSICHRIERCDKTRGVLETTLALWRKSLMLRALANFVREVDLKEANLASAAIPALKLDEADNQLLAVVIEHIYPLQKETERRLATIVVQAFEF